MFIKVFILVVLGLIIPEVINIGAIPFKQDFKGENVLFRNRNSEVRVIDGNSVRARLVIITPETLRPRTKKILATVTAYNAGPGFEWQTDSTPCITASNLDICKYPDKYNVIACPAWLEFGTKIQIGNEVFSCQDRLSRRFRYSKNPAYFDILKPTLQEALEFGRQKNVEVIIYLDEIKK